MAGTPVDVLRIWMDTVSFNTPTAWEIHTKFLAEKNMSIF